MHGYITNSPLFQGVTLYPPESNPAPRSPDRKGTDRSWVYAVKQ
jgi:hypothetical protein